MPDTAKSKTSGSRTDAPLSPAEQIRRFNDLCAALDGDDAENAVVLPTKPPANARKLGGRKLTS